MKEFTPEQIQQLFDRIEELEGMVEQRDKKIQSYRELLGGFKVEITKALD